MLLPLHLSSDGDASSTEDGLVGRRINFKNRLRQESSLLAAGRQVCSRQANFNSRRLQKQQIEVAKVLSTTSHPEKSGLFEIPVDEKSLGVGGQNYMLMHYSTGHWSNALQVTALQ